MLPLYKFSTHVQEKYRRFYTPVPNLKKYTGPFLHAYKNANPQKRDCRRGWMQRPRRRMLPRGRPPGLVLFGAMFGVLMDFIQSRPGPGQCLGGWL